MFVTRLMSKSELQAFKEGKEVRPNSLDHIFSDCNNTGDYPELWNGCFYFLRGDARRMTALQLSALRILTDNGEDHEDRVLAVFNVHGLKLYHGNAIIKTRHYNPAGWVFEEIPVQEFYVTSYSQESAELIWADWNWADTKAYIGELVRRYEWDTLDESGTEYLGAAVPEKYAYPYRRRIRQLAKGEKTKRWGASKPPKG